jgi:hypothetical protein
MAEYEGVPEAQVPQVAQLLSEKANAEALGLTDQVEAAEKGLDALGYKGAAEKRKAAAEDSPEAKSEPPKERSSKKQDSTDK